MSGVWPSSSSRCQGRIARLVSAQDCWTIRTSTDRRTASRRNSSRDCNLGFRRPICPMGCTPTPQGRNPQNVSGSSNGGASVCCGIGCNVALGRLRAGKGKPSISTAPSMAIAVPIEFTKPAQCAQRVRLEPSACRRDAIPRAAPLGRSANRFGCRPVRPGQRYRGNWCLSCVPAVPQEVAARHELTRNTAQPVRRNIAR